MRIVLFGASGMVGQGVLRECLLDPGVESVLSIGRSSTGIQHPKVREVLRRDLMWYTDIEPDLTGFEACFFCLGVSTSETAPVDYERITYGITMAAAETLCRLNPGMTFIYVSGAGTDSTERGRMMWARVKGRTENALLRLSFRRAYMFRPGIIQPVHGAQSKTAWYRVIYSFTKPLLPLLQSAFPNYVLTTEDIGRAMLIAARSGAPKHILEARDIRALVSATVKP